MDEQTDLLMRFMLELQKPTGDGKKKRQGGQKPPWYTDSSHEAAIFSHIMKWKRGEKFDPESGAHPLVHAAWRCLAIACKETGNIPDGSCTTPSGPGGDNSTETGSGYDRAAHSPRSLATAGPEVGGDTTRATKRWAAYPARDPYASGGYPIDQWVRGDETGF